MSRLEKKDINPIVSTYSYQKIIDLFGDDGKHVAKLMGVNKPKTTKKKKVKGGE